MHPIIVLLAIMSCLFVIPSDAHTQSYSDVSPEQMVRAVNYIRTNGCKCGRKRMPPVGPIKWNDKLEYSAATYAAEMARTKRFDHVSRNGDNVGTRLDRANYYWQYSGENIGLGQTSFKQALEDWIKSKSHCEMIMDPRMKDMGIGRSGKYWVQHFGVVMPANSKRGRMRYTEN